MNDEIEDGIDALLRERFDGSVLDDGFCASVMGQLPATRRRKNWPLMAGAAAGLAACWLSLWSAPITVTGWKDWLSGELSSSAIALFVALASMAILALAWTVAEADDRYDPSFRPMIG